MLEATTIPYVKSYDENGNVLNKLENHNWDGSNRRSRREAMQKVRLKSGLVVIGKYAYYRTLQFEKDKNGDKKIIQHLLPKICKN